MKQNITDHERKMNAERNKGVLYGFIVQYLNDHQYPPTLREMSEFIGKSNPCQVEYLLAKLEDEGLIEIDKTRFQRAVKVTNYKFVSID